MRLDWFDLFSIFVSVLVGFVIFVSIFILLHFCGLAWHMNAMLFLALFYYVSVISFVSGVHIFNTFVTYADGNENIEECDYKSVESEDSPEDEHKLYYISV